MKADFESYARGLPVPCPIDGWTLPETTEALVNATVRSASPIRQIARIKSIRTNHLIVQAPGGGQYQQFSTMELYAMPAATQALLDDSAVNIDQWIAEEVRLAFAQQEGQAFVTGDGINKPRGFLAYPIVADRDRGGFQIGAIYTGARGAFPAVDPHHVLINLVYALKAQYRGNGTFVMNRATQSVIRKMKDADGNYLWQPAAQPGAPSTLMGFPLVECEDMPDIAPGAPAIAFGDFERGYLIVDRIGIKVLRDPYSAKPYVLFYTTTRVGGGVRDFEAIKVLRFQ